MSADFVHLHVHTEYSMLDGLAKVPKLIKKVKDLGQTAVAMTDHGGMYGAISFYNACREAEIKPIIGCELYIAKNSLHDKQIKPGDDQAHLTVLAENFEGYRNLMRLVSIANLEGFSYKPRIDEETLEKYSEGLIVLSGCMNSPFNRLLRNNKDEEALEKFKKYQKIFGDRLYVELQNHPSIPELKDLNKKLVAIARKLKLDLVATNDVHYIEKDEVDAQDALICVQTRKLISDEKRMKMKDNPDFYLKSGDEMKNLFAEYPEAIENTLKIAERCNVKIPTGQLIFPKYPLPKGETAETWLKKMVYKGMEKKFKEITPALKERAEYEMGIINDKGYPTYFLITQDFVNWAKNNGIGVGPGRGSAAGSLVSFCLNITTLDPMEHGLPFERFLNPERPTPPDIDIDFADDRREEVIEYASKTYGHDHVGHVITFGKMEARVAIRDIGRVLGLPYEDPDKIAKLIPNDPGKKTSLADAIKNVPELGEYYKQPKFKKLLDLAQKVEGTIRHSSVHAAAVIIADKALSEYTPIQRDGRSGKMITQYDMYSLDCNVDDNAIGLLKFDFLGLRNLSTLQTAVNLIRKYQKIEIDLDTLPLDDKKTYELLSSGETSGVFQLESGGMRRVAKNLQPSQFSDITAMLALYRPGPMDLIPRFIEGKHNPEKVAYPDESLKPILGETYGIMVYQEQVLEIVHHMAGYSLGEADMLRRAIGKKKKKILDKNKNRFITESVKKGYKKEVAEKVWSFIEAFANYGFNKSHAASYAMISYQTAYLKANYPVEYMAALMTVETNSHSMTSDEKVNLATATCKEMGIIVLPPDINKSDDTFTIETNENSLQKKAIRFSLTSIKNVGTAAIENILETRKANKKDFHSFTEFLYKTDGRKVNKKVIESLVKVGTMDGFGTRASMLENLEDIRQTATQFQSEVDGQDNLFTDVATTSTTNIEDTFTIIPEYPLQELLSFEKELLGMYLTSHPLANQLEAVQSRSNKNIADIDQLLHKGQIFLFGGILTRTKIVRTKKTGAEMAFGNLQDSSGTVEVVFFPKVFEAAKDYIVQDRVILVKAKVEVQEDEVKLIAEKVTVPKEEEVEFATDTLAQEIFIPRKTSKETLQKLGKLLKANPGKTNIVIIIPNGGKPERMKLPYGVEWNKTLEEKVAELLK
ncbi:MAG: DNA polymerase III subunit alpha [Candidatus Pacebacteria bacterium CG10_big_fil_rev_8_21_14_0_10_36_11]|nr:DNA polymerase III subunit alpha [Candidatus Pacearchaeota archaeon]OIP74522.1 MAG: DNA polymerase III subunit alpha [Candidatus Pacebacteria bacterium CG2_30_36_39]PIR65148.1 MAG: DNA polymerase III subunit alpha [Candidatus Pacebacteria bacterium CG10_big_fil_rev_8_21_14_0_10_36_11]PJC42639.1 MAG: DNA polymerase III subunit alpha [Candidatus Pacebacteria bacterium CG_4_9_14_0_2_um_filter_36_8]